MVGPSGVGVAIGAAGEMVMARGYRDRQSDTQLSDALSQAESGGAEKRGDWRD